MNTLLLRATVRAQTTIVDRHRVGSDEYDHESTDGIDGTDGTDGTDGRDHRGRLVRDVGQATTEYALVLLGAAAVALLVVTWATAGGGAGRIGRLFDRVIDAVLGRI